MVTYRVSKTIHASLSYTYDWCTDLREDDNKITGSKRQKKMLEKSRKRAVYISNYVGSDGKPKTGVSIVTLKPRDSWHLEFIGEEDNETGDYKLTRLGNNRTKLDMIFKEEWKNIARIPSKDELIDHSNKLWDKFVAALENDYISKKRATG